MRHLKITLFFIVTLAIYFSFGFHHIGKFMTADEHLWIYKRIPKYWNAVKDQDWKGTYVHEKPGITLSIISGIGLSGYDGTQKYLAQNHASITGDTQPIEKMLSDFRLPILVFNGLFSIFFFWILKKITGNDWVALWSAILILLSPILLGASQIVNSDSLLWTFATATILSFIAYLEKGGKKFALLTSFFLGLSMLTKFTATILMPFLFVVAIFFFFERMKDFSEKKESLSKKIKESAVAYFAIILGSVSVFAILLPASFYELKRYLYDGTVGYSIMPFILIPIALVLLLLIAESHWLKNRHTIAILGFLHKTWIHASKLIYALLTATFLVLIINYFFGQDFLWLERVPFDARQANIFKHTGLAAKYLLEFRPIVFSLAPLVILLCLFIWTKSFFLRSKENLLILSFSSFILIYNVAVIQQGLLNTIRYNIIIYPSFFILAAIGLHSALSPFKKSWVKPVATIAIISVSALSLWMIKPFYFNYTNFLLPKEYIVVDSWGYGGYEAAAYLNSLPDAEKKIAWTDYYGFCDFFKGKCLENYSIDQSKDPIDYFVLTRRGEIQYYDKMNDKSFIRKSRNVLQLRPYYENNSPLWELQIDQRPENFVKILAK